jgi:hypothetical protein|uniref:Uncharacterized protein n=1 Tax=Ectopseudomonas mendocina (strain ymp) TaxID=399739 RepID=A4XVJ3_ECTM1
MCDSVSHLPTSRPANSPIWAKLPFSRHLSQLQGDPFLALRKLVAQKAARAVAQVILHDPARALKPRWRRHVALQWLPAFSILAADFCPIKLH